MFDDLDEALRQFLIREIPIKNGEVDIEFDQPRREWSARISRPTLNLFLWDVRENVKLRQTQPMWEVEHNPDGTVTQRRKPVRVDAHYMVTAWATEPEDEHRLMGRVLMALFRFPYLPPELLPEGLRLQPVPLSFMTAQTDELRNPTDVWNVMDNEMRPAIALTITLALDPYQPITGPVVRTRELRAGLSRRPATELLDQPLEREVFWTVGGRVRTRPGLDSAQLRLVLVEQAVEVPLQAEGRFAIGRLRAGHYTLELSVEGEPPRSFAITVPSADYELEA